MPHTPASVVIPGQGCLKVSFGKLPFLPKIVGEKEVITHLQLRFSFCEAPGRQQREFLVEKWGEAEIVQPPVKCHWAARRALAQRGCDLPKVTHVLLTRTLPTERTLGVSLGLRPVILLAPATDQTGQMFSSLKIIAFYWNHTTPCATTSCAKSFG